MTSGPHRPLIVGVAGGTGSGKTRLAQNLLAALADGASLIQQDMYYRDRSHLPPEQREGINYDHPDAVDSPLLAEHLRALKAGNKVEIPIYDYVTHTRKTETRPVDPTRVILVEGIMVLCDGMVRAELDIKIYVDTDADIRLLRRLKRDIEKRGRTLGQVMEQYQQTVRPMHLAYVEPSKRYADLIVPEGGKNPIALDVILARLRQAGGLL
jgi:uridine kinase